MIHLYYSGCFVAHTGILGELQLAFITFLVGQGMMKYFFFFLMPRGNGGEGVHLNNLLQNQNL